VFGGLLVHWWRTGRVETREIKQLTVPFLTYSVQGNPYI
jgi:hypothetical protein